jgi:predicted small lipoprotein YifL
MQTVRITLLALFCLVVLGACGNKGPLYIPNENPVVKPETDQEPDEDEEDSENKEDTGKENPSRN